MEQSHGLPTDRRQAQRIPEANDTEDRIGRALLRVVLALRVTLLVGICFSVYAIAILMLMGVRP